MKTIVAVAVSFIAVLSLSTTVSHAQVEGVGVARQGLVIGSDDRQLVNNAWLAANPRYRDVVDAIGQLVFPGGTCTASYVGGGIALTAGHCVDAPLLGTRNMPCDKFTIQWGFRVDSPPYLTSQCKRILSARQSPPYDYAVLEISPFPRTEIRAVQNAGGTSGVTSPGVMLGHPGGGPLRWSGTCYLPPYASAIAHQCDSEPGSSGSLILEEKFLLAIGIHYGHTGALNAGIYLAHVPIGEIMASRFAPHGKITGIGGKCLDVTDGKTTDRTAIQLWNCSGDGAQRWSLSPYGTVVGLDGKCLDTPVSNNGTRTWLFGCHYGANQHWTFEVAQVRWLGKCMDVPGVAPANSTRVQVWDCHGGDGQKWTYTAAHEIRNAQGKCLDAQSFHPGNGTPVVVFDCHGGANQMWDLTQGGTIEGIGGMCVDVSGGHSSNGTPLQLYGCNRTAAQHWSLTGVIRGLDGKCLDAQTASANPPNGTPVVVFDCHFGANQMWRYEPFLLFPLRRQGYGPDNHSNADCRGVGAERGLQRRADVCRSGRGLRRHPGSSRARTAGDLSAVL